jgi:histidyl-tRNA synthetase
MPEQAKRSFSAPKGMRDMYPAELLRRRYIEKLWRDTAIRHGFEEIDGPAFEHTELYTAKSGEGIASEIFGVFSGKDEAEVAALRAGGQAPFALRPEFTPTLARMYAARAAQLPKPTKWFWQQNCYRAERPQRGRLREFGQWNVDVIGGDASPTAQVGPTDVDTIACCVDLLRLLQLTPNEVRVGVSDRRVVANLLIKQNIPHCHIDDIFELLDRSTKMSADTIRSEGAKLSFDIDQYLSDAQLAQSLFISGVPVMASDEHSSRWSTNLYPIKELSHQLNAIGLLEWCGLQLSIVRGLAYYTGMVFEVHETSGAERAVAGGGRYDNLIETFGGPPTPAVGFGMGDVVLGNILQDRGLMPEGRDLLAALSAPSASFRPDVFVIANEKDESQQALRPLVAYLRRGVESEAWLAKEGRKPWDPDRYAARPLHARHSYKATKNIGKLLQEAGAQHARFAAIIESAGEATLKNLDTREELRNVPLDGIAARLG